MKKLFLPILFVILWSCNSANQDASQFDTFIEPDKVQKLEHRMYPEVINWFSEDKLKLVGDQVWLNGKELSF